MLSRLNHHVSVFLAALLGVLAGSVGPGVARAAYDAVNADKVDGFHAVGAGTPAGQRAGRLVAANGKGRAPDSEKLNGYPHKSLRVLALPVQGVAVEGWVKTVETVTTSGTSNGLLGVGVLVPKDHVAGTPLYMDVLFAEGSTDACDMYLSAPGLFGPVGDVLDVGNWALPGGSVSGTVTIPAGPLSGHLRTFTWTGPSDPGDAIGFRLTRYATDEPADTCPDIEILGLQLRY